jgi:hypothetical protein
MTPNLPRAANDSRRGGAPAFTPVRLARPSLTPHRLAGATRDWSAIDSYARNAIDAGDYLRSRAVPQVTVTWPARLLVWAVMAAVSAYCAAIWATGGAL